MDETYPFPGETLPRLPMGAHLEDLSEIREYLEKIGIRTSNTRIDRYSKCLRLFEQGCQDEAPKAFGRQPTETFARPEDCLLYVYREVHELMWIVRGLRKFHPKGVDAKLKEIVGGSDFAASDGDSASRNTQFELRIASYFCQAGFDVDMSRLTDIVAIGDKDVYFVECKRVGNQGQLKRRISEGRKQLRERMPKGALIRALHGCVAVDVTKVAYPHNGVTWAMSNDHSRATIQRKLVSLADSLRDGEVFRGEKGFVHCWLQIHIPMLIYYPMTIGSRFSSYHIFKEDRTRKEEAAIRRFCEFFESVPQGDEREVPSRKLRPRTIISLPAGTKFSFDEKLIEEFLSQGKVATRNPEEIIGSLAIGEEEMEFTFFEFELYSSRISEDQRRILSEDGMKAGLMLLGGMRNMRNPYLADGELDDPSEA